MPEEMFTLKDLAREWGRSVRTVGRWLRACKAKVKRPSKRTILISATEKERVWKKMDCRYEWEGPANV